MELMFQALKGPPAWDSIRVECSVAVAIMADLLLLKLRA
jgi:hypothetical protein